MVALLASPTFVIISSTAAELCNPRRLTKYFGASFSCHKYQQALLHTSSSSSTNNSSMASPPAKKPQQVYGSWKSPLTADLVASSGKKLANMGVDGTGSLIWLEGRPTEAGRGVLVQGVPEGYKDLTPPGFNVRTLVHEYGGGAFTVDGDIVIFSNYKDQRLYLQLLGKDVMPVPLTPEYGGTVVRYADGVVDRRRNRYITVREDHRHEKKEPLNEIVLIDLNGDQIQEPEVFIGGNDFYSFPRLNADGSKIAWIEWSHPNMPWDRSQLWVADLTVDGKILQKWSVAGENLDVVEAPTEPKWSPSGDLFYVTDKHNGYWNLYHWNAKSNISENLCPMEAEFTKPAWVFGNSSFDFLQEKAIVCSYRKKGKSYVGVLDLSSKVLRNLELPFTEVYDLVVSGNEVFIEVASASQPISIIKVDLLSRFDVGMIEHSLLWSSNSLDLSNYKAYLTTPEIIEFPTAIRGKTAFANFYPPHNDDYVAPEGQKPPLLIRCHGGPTAESRTSLNLGIQYWTSRGWAVGDVNYGGSTGYGREYRERLFGAWGIVDVDDCCSCAEYLVASGKVDSTCLCIDGGSAGGYTTLASLVFKDVFKAGASLYGIGDLFVLAGDTHKFESHYLQSLVGNDHKVIYDRSPINFLEKLACPIILFQGLEDKVVPATQAQLIYTAVRGRKVPVALIEYEGEQHGFRKAENIKYTLEQEMVFFARVVAGFDVADNIVPVHVDNFDK